MIKQQYILTISANFCSAAFHFLFKNTSILVIMLSIIKQTNSFFNKPFGFPHNFMYVCNRNQIQHLHL